MSEVMVVATRGSENRMTTGLDFLRLRHELALSGREAELVCHILEGKKLSTIARDMGLALGTVKTYAQRLYRKVGVRDQRELAVAILLHFHTPLLPATAG